MNSAGPLLDAKKRMSKKKIIGEMIEHFGGATALQKSLERHGFNPVTADGIYKWWRRGSIPAQRLVDLQKLGTRLRRPINVQRLLRGLGRAA